jgi:hypothetical protein
MLHPSGRALLHGRAEDLLELDVPAGVAPERVVGGSAFVPNVKPEGSDLANRSPK